MKEIILYTKDGVQKQVLPVATGSKVHFSLGKEDYVNLRFSVDTPIPFKLGDRIRVQVDIPNAGIYELTELPTPTYNQSTGGYDYDVRFDAHYYKWKNKIFKYTPENASSEASWSLTAPLHTHMEVFLRNLKALGYKYQNQDYVYIIDGSVENKSVAMEYANENMLDALFRMASESAWNCDVWVSGNKIHFGHCESGDTIPLRRGIEVASSQKSESKGVYATRLYAFGGERNIPRSYGKRFIDSVQTSLPNRFTGVLHNTNYYLEYDAEVDVYFLSGVDKGKTFRVAWMYGYFYPRGEELIKAKEGDKFEILNFPESVPDRYLSYGTDGLTVNGVVQKRLMMPRNTPYIDVYPDMTTEEAIEAVVVFDDIYPRRVGTLSNIEEVQRDVKDGDKVVDKFTAYQYTDAGLTFKDEYKIEGEELKITFQGDSKLSGMTFEVQFDPDDKKEQKWEIFRNEDYGRPLPDETLKPENGDEYVLSGFNIKLVSDSYIPTAEKELETKARQYAEKIKNDDGTFTVTMNPIWVHDNNKYLPCGQKVTFTDDAMFSGSRDLRVLGYEINLDIPYDSPTYTIGQSMPFSRLGNIETQLEAVTFKGSTYVSGGGSGSGSNVYVVKRDDATEPSDFNVFSSLRSLKTLLRKDKDDTTEYLLTLLKGAVFGNNKATIDSSGIATLVSAIIGNGNARIDADGASAFKSIAVREGVASDNFSTGALGSGFALKKDENNDSYLEVDRMMVRKTATFVELLIQRLRHVGGQIILSPASMTCERVEDRSDAYRCYFRSTDGSKTVANEFVVGDQARCQTFNIKPGMHQGVQNQYYWRLVTAVGDNYIDLSKSDCDKGSTVPQAGDDIVQLGHRSDITRQCAIILAAHGAGSPYIKMYRGINSYAVDGKEFVTFSREKVNITANSLQFSTGKDVEGAINTAQDAASDAQKAADNAQSAAKKAQDTADAAKSEFTQTADRIMTEVSKLTKEGEKLSSQINQTDSKITTEVSRLEKEDTKLSSRIDQTANKITSEVSRLEGEDAKLSSRIDHTAESISLKVNEVIGGENLIDGASFLTSDGFNGWATQGDLMNHGIQNWTEVGSTCLKITFEKQGCGIRKPIGERGTAILKEGLTFTYSFDVRRANTSNINPDSLLQVGIDEENIKTIRPTDISTTQWQRISVTTTAGRINSNNFGMYFHTNQPASVVLYIKCIKIELGNRATAYTASNADTLFSTGIDIQRNAITLTADKTTIRNNKGVQIAMFTDKAGKPLIKAEHIDVDNLYVKHLDGATGNFSGTLNAATGSFSGEVTATSGKIGRLTIEDGMIVGENGNVSIRLRSNNQTSFLDFGNTNIKTQVYFDSNENTYVPPNPSGQNEGKTLGDYFRFQYYLQDSMSRFNMFYALTESQVAYSPINTAYGKKYGYQYSTIGSGHIAIDGIVDGGCFALMNKFTADEQRHRIFIPEHGNKIVTLSNYNNCALVLPSHQMIENFYGCEWTVRKSTPFNFVLYIISYGGKPIRLIGYNTATFNGGTPYNNTQFPNLYDRDGNWHGGTNYFLIQPLRVYQIMLSYDGWSYNAFIM